MPLTEQALALIARAWKFEDAGPDGEEAFKK
jgi:hypothetical protein